MRYVWLKMKRRDFIKQCMMVAGALTLPPLVVAAYQREDNTMTATEVQARVDAWLLEAERRMRPAFKAMTLDMMTYGTGIMKLTGTGEIHHVPLSVVPVVDVSQPDPTLTTPDLGTLRRMTEKLLDGRE